MIEQSLFVNAAIKQKMAHAANISLDIVLCSAYETERMVGRVNGEKLFVLICFSFGHDGFFSKRCMLELVYA